MDLYTINLRKFHIHYFAYLVFVVTVSYPLLFRWVEPNFRFVFYLGVALSFFIQLSATELRFLPRFKPSLGESGFPLFTVPLFFFINLGVLSALVLLDYPFETIIGFLIAYFLHLLFFVIASYFSGK
ncbi:hypothetical protein EHQ58_05785 [Leptospira ognonensis]|uniref:Uncharacterized protein n=1 Tax=Leptospira ognonensis TaxID=2484945 RepID=A0A4R9K6T7_9LEPT|nr:hypothetical protein [Leptospira ognonensis]TGL61286.1 hypothetical protein EHQ58_05785 [Leptospira ognonensis]